MSIIIDKKIKSWRVADKKPTFQSHNAPKRPKDLECDIHQVKVKGESWTVIIGLYDNKPYEVFGGLSKFVEIPKKYKKGSLAKGPKKEGISVYNLVCGQGDDQIIIKDIINTFENHTHGAFTRLISLSLRHGAKVEYIVEQIQKDKHSDITSFSKVIARVLKEYISPDYKPVGKQCEKCGSTNLVFQAACFQCLDCDHSKCE